jgi:hypothetical protein
MSQFTDEDRAAIKSLRDRGFAVCVFTPQELQDGKVGRQDMEQMLVESGNEVLVDLEDVRTWRDQPLTEETNELHGSPVQDQDS